MNTFHDHLFVGANVFVWQVHFRVRVGGGWGFEKGGGEGHPIELAQEAKEEEGVTVEG